MKRLSKVVNIVPVIAKADTLTLEERDYFKQRVRGCCLSGAAIPAGPSLLHGPGLSCRALQALLAGAQRTPPAAARSDRVRRGAGLLSKRFLVFLLDLCQCRISLELCVSRPASPVSFVVVVVVIFRLVSVILGG